ncbi:MAG: hypothetical protein M3132_10955 [Actinomycetia bacterium]|nr:hypothetical protein [Actinomycetes bacterium]
MPLIAGPFHIVVGLLAIAGVAKLARPAATADVARAAGIPASQAVVRIFALLEVGAAATALVFGGWQAALGIALLYGAFAVFVIMLSVRGIETAGCGCFGQETEEPPGRIHVGLDLVAAAIALLAVASPVPDLASVLAVQPLAGMPYIGFVLMGVWLSMVVLTEFPRLMRIASESAT